jgi:RNA polymerase sigma-70 factor (ECF subfamily)
MPPPSLNERLSRISTLWTVLLQAHQAPTASDTWATAVQLLMQRYSGAVYRYLLGAVRDADAAEELSQEFALKWVRGDFRRADPVRGRFRDYLRTALSHLVNDYHRGRQNRPGALSPEAPEPAAPPAESLDSDRAFIAQWREELLNRTWTALAEINSTYHAVLLCRIENPELPSPEMAGRLSAQLGRPFTAASVRKVLQRAHEKYADLLLEEVASTLPGPTPDSLQQEIQELGLLGYCRSALERRRQP